MANDENIVYGSFLSNLINDLYDKKIASLVFVIYTIVLLVLFGISFVCYWSFFGSLFYMLTGWSLFFIAYIVSFIIFCDIRVPMRVDTDLWRTNIKLTPINTRAYKMTIAWTIILVAIGIAAIIFTNKYRKNYYFDCQTYYVEKSVGIYHLGDHCDDISGSVVEMKGYEIRENGYTLCDLCSDIAEMGEDDRFVRK